MIRLFPRSTSKQFAQLIVVERKQQSKVLKLPPTSATATSAWSSCSYKWVRCISSTSTVHSGQVDHSTQEYVEFPVANQGNDRGSQSTKPVLLNAKEHVVGYLSRILNARVYDAAIETELQHAKNLSISLKNSLM